MAKITYKTASQGDMIVEVPEGFSVMEGAIREGVPGIEAECGGQCACATCRVDVAEEWVDRLLPKDLHEEALLESTIDPTPRSRLACQIRVGAELNGLVVEVPAT